MIDYSKIKEELDTCKNPLFFFHNDQDGLASFLLFYRYKKEGKGVILKTSAEMGPEFITHVNNYNPDKIFILDKPKVSQDFLDNAKRPVIWIDHHTPVERQKVKYFNPRLKNPKSNIPCSYLCYKVVNQDIWIAMLGCIGDWFYPDFADDFIKAYTDLIDKKTKNPGKIYFETKLGKLVKLFSFILKGSTKDAMSCVKILTRINDPYEILKAETSRAKFLMKRYDKVEKEYTSLLNQAKKHIKENILLYICPQDKMSLNSDLSNELLYRHPEKIIIVGREKSGEVKLSLRVSKLNLQPILEKALVGIDGYGGGHEHACGANIKKHDFDRFMEQFKEEIK